MQRVAGLVHRQRHHIEQHVGAPVARVLAAHHAAHLAGAYGQRTILAQQPARAHAQHLQGLAHVVVERERMLQFDDDARLVVVLQIAADFRRIHLHGDAVAAQQFGRAHARQLQQLRRLQRAGGQQHLGVGLRPHRLAAPAFVHPFHAAADAAVDQQARDAHAGQHGQVGPAAHRMQERGGSAAAPASLEGELVIAQAAVARAVEIGIGVEAGLQSGLDPVAAQRVVVAQVRDAQLAGAAVVFARAAAVALGLAEVGQHVAIAPALRAGARPVVVIRVLAADVDQPVDRTGAAQYAAARPDDGALARLGLGLDRKLPREARIVDRAEVPHRQPQPEVAVLAAGLQQQYAAGRVGGEAVGQHAAGRAGADDDVVIRSAEGGRHRIPGALRRARPPGRVWDRNSARPAPAGRCWRFARRSR